MAHCASSLSRHLAIVYSASTLHCENTVVADTTYERDALASNFILFFMVARTVKTQWKWIKYTTMETMRGILIYATSLHFLCSSTVANDKVRKLGNISGLFPFAQRLCVPRFSFFDGRLSCETAGKRFVIFSFEHCVRDIRCKRLLFTLLTKA